MAIIDRTIIRRLTAAHAETIDGFTVRHAGEALPDDADVAVVLVEAFTLEHQPRANTTDADIAGIELSLIVQVGTHQVDASIYALDSALSLVTRHFLLSTLVNETLRCEWTSCRSEDLGELEGHQVRVGRVTLRGEVIRASGDDVESHI